MQRSVPTEYDKAPTGANHWTKLVREYGLILAHIGLYGDMTELLPPYLESPVRSMQDRAGWRRRGESARHTPQGRASLNST